MAQRARGRSDRGTSPEQQSAEELEQRARETVIRQLSMMDRSRFQLDEAMKRKEIPENIRESILDHFTDLGLIDDAHFAEILVRTRFEEKGASRRAIADELRRKGITQEIIESALADIGEDDEYEAALRLARKKLAGGGNPATLTRRVYATLARRGYSPSVCGKALRAAQAQVEDEGFDQALY